MSSTANESPSIPDVRIAPRSPDRWPSLACGSLRETFARTSSGSIVCSRTPPIAMNVSSDSHATCARTSRPARAPRARRPRSSTPPIPLHQNAIDASGVRHVDDQMTRNERTFHGGKVRARLSGAARRVLLGVERIDAGSPRRARVPTARRARSSCSPAPAALTMRRAVSRLAEAELVGARQEDARGERVARAIVVEQCVAPPARRARRRARARGGRAGTRAARAATRPAATAGCAARPRARARCYASACSAAPARDRRCSPSRLRRARASPPPSRGRATRARRRAGP